MSTIWESAFICLIFHLNFSDGRAISPGAVQGSCPPQPAAMASFDLQKYAGEWFEAKSVPAYFNAAGTTCYKTTYALHNSTTLKTQNVYTDPAGIIRETCRFLIQSDQSGNLQQGGNERVFKDLLLLDTDYTSYGALYSCEEQISDNGTRFKVEYGRVVTRSNNSSMAAVNKGMAAFTSRNISTASFKDTFQDGSCDYDYPGVSCVETDYINCINVGLGLCDDP